MSGAPDIVADLAYGCARVVRCLGAELATGELVDIDDVGLTTAYLATPFARRLTGTVTYVDGGIDIMA